MPHPTTPLQQSFASDSFAMKLGRLKLVAGKTLPSCHVDDVVLYADIETALVYISALEEGVDSLGLQKAQCVANLR